MTFKDGIERNGFKNIEAALIDRLEQESSQHPIMNFEAALYATLVKERRLLLVARWHTRGETRHARRCGHTQAHIDHWFHQWMLVEALLQQVEQQMAAAELNREAEYVQS